MVKTYIPLNCKTHFSVLRSSNKPPSIANRINELELPTCCVAEYGNLSSTIQVLAKNPAALIGYDDGKTLIIAQNIEGWYELVKYNNQILDKKEIMQCLFIHYDPNAEMNMALHNHFIGIDLNSKHYSTMRGIAGPKVAIPTFLASTKQDQLDFYVVMCLKENTHLEQLSDDFLRKDWFISDYERLREIGYTENELRATNNIADMCEPLIFSPDLKIPPFPCPDNLSSNEWLKQLCNKGFIRLGFNSKEQYLERIRMEMSVIERYHLEDYFLIIKDIMDYTKKKHSVCGVRGSAGGCLLSYLLGITAADPVINGLYFSRFLNEGRFTAERIQPPDIDIDLPSEAREDVIQYIRNKYGQDKTGQITTFSHIKSSAAIKAVFRVNNTLSFGEVNRITKGMPMDHQISDKMSDTGETSVIMYCLKHRPKLLSEWVRINASGELEGDYCKEFEQAIRLEGINAAISRHAAGIIVGKEPLTETCPLIWDSSISSWKCGMEMNDLESGLGLLKLDLLGLRHMSKMRDIQKRLQCTSAN